MKWKKERRFIVNERALCDSHTKLNGTASPENWKICVAVYAWKNGGDIHQEERKYDSESLQQLQWSEIK